MPGGIPPAATRGTAAPAPTPPAEPPTEVAAQPVGPADRGGRGDRRTDRLPGGHDRTRSRPRGGPVGRLDQAHGDRRRARGRARERPVARRRAGSQPDGRGHGQGARRRQARRSRPPWHQTEPPPADRGGRAAAARRTGSFVLELVEADRGADAVALVGATIAIVGGDQRCRRGAGRPAVGERRAARPGRRRRPSSTRCSAIDGWCRCTRSTLAAEPVLPELFPLFQAALRTRPLVRRGG